ncbi:MAG: BatA domain-containing protein [Phycisphaeraceae bacterium]
MTTLAQVSGLFTAPGFAAAGAAAVSIPIIIHLLTRMRRKPVRWGAMKFLVEAFRKQRTRLQLEQWLLLLVRCLVLLILGLALAGPLLGGCASTMGIDATGRSLYLVLDDALSERAIGENSKERFERQKDLAIKLIDSLGSADQVALFTTSRPSQGVVDPPTIDRAAVRRTVEGLQPKHGRSDLAGALRDVRASLVEKGQPADRAFVVMLSDFSQGSVSMEQTLPEQATKLDQLARVLAARPMASLPNVQINRFQPRRHMILTGGLGDGGPVRIPVEIDLQRFADDTAARVTSIELALVTDDLSKPLAVFAKQEVRWNEGEEKASVRADLIVNPETLDALNLGPGNLSVGRSSGATVVLRARIEPDALLEDNERFAVVELRQRLRVGIISETASSVRSSDRQITADRWLAIGLSPTADLGAIELVDILAISLDSEQLQALDAAMILRPDQLNDSAWMALAELARRGGLVWVFAPATDGAATWAEAMKLRFGVNWNVAIDPQTLAGVAPVAPPAAPEPDVATSTGLGLAVDKSEPEALRLLAADWKDLLRPIRLKKRLVVEAPGSADSTWLWAEDGKPLLVTANLGEGSVFLLATALDLEWSNLPTKPLFVPLLHESLRSVQARSAEAARLAGIVSGDLPALGDTWDGVTGLDRLANEITGAAQANVLLRRTDKGFTPASPLDEPGVYRAAPDAQGRLLVVNVDPAAGNTRALDASQLEAWLSPLGRMTWLDETNPALAFAAFDSRANVGHLLLWAVLALVLVEVFLARWFSHAQQGQQHTIMGLGTMVLRRLVGKKGQ